MGAFLATAEGRGKPLTRTGSAKTGARGMAGTWNVRAEAGAFWEDPTMGGRGAFLALRLQALSDLPRPNGQPFIKGEALQLWTGTEAEALLMAEAGRSHAKAAAFAKLALRVLRMAEEALPPAGMEPTSRRLQNSEVELVKALRNLGGV